ncbi:MAG: hypothetical protein N4A74_17725 [Carboxylicivirga sp.]|nr:hypothetical protein [Carboxylicivirga sp.]
MNKIVSNLLVLVFSILAVNAVATNKTERKNNSFNEMKIRMVLFTPADIEQPKDYRERMKKMADYSEMFFAKWMKYWGYPCENPLKIDRDSKGYPEIIAIKGKYNYGHDAYKKLSDIKKEVIQQANEKYGIPSKGQVWWILNYPKKKRGSRGGGNSINGGFSFGNYIDSDEQIDLEKELGAEGMHEKILFKSLIHELTHGLGLGHIGPRDREDLGNSLMGPVNRGYKKVYVNDSRVHLSEAAAALLWKHPLMEGDNTEKVQMPEVTVKKLRVKYNNKSNEFEVEGKIESNIKAHSVVVLDASEGDKSEYWHKAYVGKVKSNGTFKCAVTELKKTNGELRIAFCFENGAITGSGKKAGVKGGGIIKQYKFSDPVYSVSKDGL